jgi:hypothetical protein
MRVKLALNAYVGMERRAWRRLVNSEGRPIDLPWGYNEPNNSGNCLTVCIIQNGYNDVLCDWDNNFVCQKVEEGSSK